MISPNAMLIEQAKLVWGAGPQVPSSTTPDYVCLKNYLRAAVLINVRNTTTVTGSAITLRQASDVSDTGGKTLAFDKVWANLDTTASDTLVETAVTSNTFTTDATNNITAMYVIDVKPEMLDIANGFDCFRAGTGDATNATLAVTYLLYPAKYGKATPPTAITD
jgi:hypothetical protein